MSKCVLIFLLGAFAIAFSISLCIQSSKIDPENFIEKVATTIRDTTSLDEKARTEFASYVSNLKLLLKKPPNKVVDVVGKLGLNYLVYVIL